MSCKSNVRAVFFGFLALALFAFSGPSYADWSIGVGVGGGDHHDGGGDHRFYRYHDHPQFGVHAHFLPDGYVTVWSGGVRYFYYDGLYYSSVGQGDYVLVNPPMGAYVATIPQDFQPVIINGMTYYINNGIYYVRTPQGYQVVAAPEVQQTRQQVIVDQRDFPVNIPTNSGGYITVVLKRSGNGYVGPQGEFYPTFPSVGQLRAMYGK